MSQNTSNIFFKYTKRKVNKTFRFKWPGLSCLFSSSAKSDSEIGYPTGLSKSDFEIGYPTGLFLPEPTIQKDEAGSSQIEAAHDKGFMSKKQFLKIMEVNEIDKLPIESESQPHIWPHLEPHMVPI